MAAAIQAMSPSLAALRRGWGQVIRRAYEVDPLVCPGCQSLMRVAARAHASVPPPAAGRRLSFGRGPARAEFRFALPEERSGTASGTSVSPSPGGGRRTPPPPRRFRPFEPTPSFQPHCPHGRPVAGNRSSYPWIVAGGAPELPAV